MQCSLFEEPRTKQPAAAPKAQGKQVPPVPVRFLKTYNPYAKKFYWDGVRFGVMSSGTILWLKYHEGRRFTGWIRDIKGRSPESYTEHLIKDAHLFNG